MSRTNRKYMTNGNYREARKGQTHKRRRSGTPQKVLIAAGFVAEFRGQMLPTCWLQVREPAAPWAPHDGPSRGGMLMSPSNTGMWGDEYRPGDIRTKRAVKRAERQAARREAEAALLAEAEFDAEEQEDYDERAQAAWEDYCREWIEDDLDEFAGDFLDDGLYDSIGYDYE